MMIIMWLSKYFYNTGQKAEEELNCDCIAGKDLNGSQGLRSLVNGKYETLGNEYSPVSIQKYYQHLPKITIILFNGLD
jgi:hypothetical protein